MCTRWRARRIHALRCTHSDTWLSISERLVRPLRPSECTILTFVTILALPSILAHFEPIAIAKVVAKRIVAHSTEGGTILRVVVRVAGNLEAYGYDAAILAVERAILPVRAGHGELVLHHEPIHAERSIVRQVHCERERALSRERDQREHQLLKQSNKFKSPSERIQFENSASNK